MGDLGSSTDPKMSNKATVRVTDRLEQGHIMSGFYSGKIATLIGEMRVGHETFRYRSQEARELLHETEYKVLVPCESVLHIEVDRQFENSENHQRIKHLQLLKFPNNNGTSCSKLHQVDEHHQVEVNISWSPKRKLEQTGEQEFIITSPPQPPRPVEVKMVSGKYLTVVYTIDDAVSFAEFIMTLRRILADHPGREDILDGHNELLNLCSTREHPVLTRTRSEQPDRWLHVKLQVMDEKQASWTTLLMRDDDLYVHAFVNKQGVVYELLDNNRSSEHMLPEEEYRPQRLTWTVEYKSMLDALENDQVVQKLMDKKLGYGFARNAVRVLSSHPQRPTYLDDAHIHLSAKMALAGLIVIVCESARMNPLLDSIAGGWCDGNGFNGQLMQRYVWNYTKMSQQLLSWKRRNYKDAPRLRNSQVRSLQLQAIYLVRNIPSVQKAGRLARRPGGSGEAGNAGSSGGPGHRPGESRDDAGTSGDSSRSNTATGDPAGQPSEGFSQPEEDGDSEGPNQYGEDADDVHGHGRPRVELLAMAMPRDLFVVGMKIVVFDGKRGQIIYKKEQREQEQEKEQGEEEMVELVLVGPYRGISAEYGCFAIKMDIPGTPSSGNIGNKHNSIKWEWDCDDPTCAAQVDTPQPTYQTINALDGSKVAKVTYAVMSDAREATVQVKLRLNDSHRPAGGKIDAFIDGFDVPSVLFSCTEAMDQCLSASTTSDSWSHLQLARDVVAVPCCGVLTIVVALQIKTSNDQEVKYLHQFGFDANGICSTKSHQDNNGIDVQLNISWYPEVISMHVPKPEAQQIPEVKMKPEAVYSTRDELWYTECLMASQDEWLEMQERALEKNTSRSPRLVLAFFSLAIIVILGRCLQTIEQLSKKGLIR